MEQLVRILNEPRTIAHIGGNLVQRVEIHGLDTGFAVNLRPRCVFVEHVIGDAERALIAVIEGIGEQRARFVEVAVIHTPGIDTDGVHAALFLCRLQNRALDLKQQPQRIPVESGRCHYGIVGEAVDFI